MEPERRPASLRPEAGASEPLFFLVGPTASGKSELALELAERAGAEILSLDSMLVYRGMDVGTAKPARELRRRVPHHLIDLVGPEESFGVQDYRAAAHAALEDVRSRGRRALFVGGTAFYLKALTHGLFEGPQVDPDLRARIEARVHGEGSEASHAELARVDPASASRIHANDTKRLVRALEVWEQTGRTLSSWQREWGWHAGAAGAPGRARRIVGLALPAAELERRIAERTRRMLDEGWVEEARSIRSGAGFGETSIQALGYEQVLKLADGELTRAACEREIVVRTRQFARRQRTWFRGFRELVWLDASRAAEGSAEVARGTAGAPATKDLAARAGEVFGWTLGESR